MILRRRNLQLQPRKVAFGKVCALLVFPCCSCTERAETCTVSRASMHSHGCPAYRDGKLLAACIEIPPTQYPAFLCLLDVCNLFFQPWKACRFAVGIPAPSPLLVERSNLNWALRLPGCLTYSAVRQMRKNVPGSWRARGSSRGGYLPIINTIYRQRFIMINSRAARTRRDCPRSASEREGAG